MSGTFFGRRRGALGVDVGSIPYRFTVSRMSCVREKWRLKEMMTNFVEQIKDESSAVRSRVSDRPGKRGRGWPLLVKEAVLTNPFISDRGSFPKRISNLLCYRHHTWPDLIHPWIILSYDAINILILHFNLHSHEMIIATGNVFYFNCELLMY